MLRLHAAGAGAGGDGQVGEWASFDRLRMKISKKGEIMTFKKMEMAKSANGQGLIKREEVA
jgi:hypothetical protein